MNIMEIKDVNSKEVQEQIKHKIEELENNDQNRDYFSFPKAYQLMEEEILITRKKWAKEETFIFIRPGDILDKDFIKNVKSLPESVKRYLLLKNSTVLLNPYLCFYRDGEIINGWTPTIEDLQANDYYIINQ